jgi:hypothetical protein
VHGFLRSTGYLLPGFPVDTRLDWIAAKGLRLVESETSPAVYPAPYSDRLARAVSDHHAVSACLDIERP